MRKLSRPWHGPYRVIDRSDGGEGVRSSGWTDSGASEQSLTVSTITALGILLVWFQTLGPWLTAEVGGSTTQGGPVH